MQPVNDLDSLSGSGSGSAPGAPRGPLVVGTLAQLWRFPVKSMAGEALAESAVGRHGLAGDRRYAFIRPHLQRSGFPWLTIREKVELVHYSARFADPSQPDRSVTLVTNPAGLERDVVDPALCAELGEGVTMIKQDVGVFDTAPLSLLSLQTISSLAALVSRAGAPDQPSLATLRFRPNLVVDVDPAATGGAAFPEDEWVGRLLQIGEPGRGLTVRIDARDQRCVMINVDPATGARDPAILRTVAAERQARLGVYASTVSPGHLAVGDQVMLLP